MAFRKGWKLLDVVKRARGAPRKLRRKWRERKIDELQDLVETAYVPHLRRWVRRNTHRAEVRFNRARIAKDAKASEVRDRLLGRWGRQRYLVYVPFARRGKCLKVGLSDHGFGRIVSQQDAYYFRDASRVAVFFPKRKKKKVLPALECALTHVFLPLHLYHNPASRKYRQKCPACHEMRVVTKAARKLFPA
jgi:hypothetical protein